MMMNIKCSRNWPGSERERESACVFYRLQHLTEAQRLWKGTQMKLAGAALAVNPHFEHTPLQGFNNLAQKIISINIYWLSCNYLRSQDAQWFCGSGFVSYVILHFLHQRATPGCSCTTARRSADEMRTLPLYHRRWACLFFWRAGYFAVFWSWKLVQTFYRQEAQQSKIEPHLFTFE